MNLFTYTLCGHTFEAEQKTFDSFERLLKMYNQPDYWPSTEPVKFTVTTKKDATTIKNVTLSCSYAREAVLFGKFLHNVLKKDVQISLHEAYPTFNKHMEERVLVDIKYT